MDNSIKIWWNFEKGYFEAFLPTGEPIPLLRDITVSDNYGDGLNIGPPTATITLVIEVVNQKPQVRTEPNGK